MNKPNNLVENFLQSLFTDNRAQAKEWRGANIPVGDEDNRPNLIGECMTMEGNQMKIRCLRKLRDQVAMNPFYQHRLDRFVDAITDTYEPTDEQGTIPGNEFKSTAVGEELKEGKIKTWFKDNKCNAYREDLKTQFRELRRDERDYKSCLQGGYKDNRCAQFKRGIVEGRKRVSVSRARVKKECAHQTKENKK